MNHSNQPANSYVPTWAKNSTICHTRRVLNIDLPDQSHQSPLATLSTHPTYMKVITEFKRPRRDMAEILDEEARANGLVTLSAGDATGDIKVHPDNVPTSIVLMPEGPQPAPLGYVVVDPKITAQMLPKVQSAFDLLRVPILDPGDPNSAPAEPPSEVGSGRVMYKPGEGILLVDIEFTDEGLKCLAEYTGFVPTVWVHGDLAKGEQKTVYGVKCVTFGGPNSFQMLDFPALVNLSAAAAAAGAARLARAFDAHNCGVKDFKNSDDRDSLIKLLSTGGKPVVKPEGGNYTAAELCEMPTPLLKTLCANLYPTGITLLAHKDSGVASGLTLLSAHSSTQQAARSVEDEETIIRAGAERRARNAVDAWNFRLKQTLKNQLY